MLLDDVYSRVSEQPDYHQGEAVEPGKFVIPIYLKWLNASGAYCYMVLDLTLLGMDPNISDSEMDPHAMQSGTGPSFLDEDFDCEEDDSEVHCNG